MSNLTDYAQRELRAIGYDGKDKMNNMMFDNIMELIKTFSEQGHSGFTAAYCIDVFERLARFEPLGPLTGEDNEWNEVGDGVFQNNRCSHVFKKNGKAYDIDGKIFREPDGTMFTSFDSRVDVTFPYTPKSVYIDVDGGSK